MVARVMYVTMGTSLFHSATWALDDHGLAIEMERYSGWLVAPFLDSPEKRMSDVRSDSIRSRLKRKLTIDNGDEWAQRLPKRLRTGTLPALTPMRYCAELSTLLKMAEEGAFRDFQAFLASYQEIRLCYDGDFYDAEGLNLPHVAAEHLKAILHAVFSRTSVTTLSLPGISSREPKTLLAALRTFRDHLQRREEVVDLVLTGGYKIYGALLAPLAKKDSLELIYIHEGSDNLVVYHDGEGHIAGWTTERGPD
jgi:putative CRISPR-associated protein (TIGR02619 family)